MIQAVRTFITMCIGGALYVAGCALSCQVSYWHLSGVVFVGLLVAVVNAFDALTVLEAEPDPEIAKLKRQLARANETIATLELPPSAPATISPGGTAK